MFKCWNCGTEHELPASNDAYLRGWNAAMKMMEEKSIVECNCEPDEYGHMIDCDVIISRGRE